MTFDALAGRQVPGLTDDGGYLELGAADPDHREVNPIGWQYCDLRVVGIEVP